MKKRILALALAAACAASSLSLSALAEDIPESGDGLLATWYQYYGTTGDNGNILGGDDGIVGVATGEPNNYSCAPAGNVEDKNLLFDDSIQPMLDGTEIINTIDEIDSFVAPVNRWGEFRAENGLPYNDALVVYTGKMTVKEAGNYTFDGKIDNGMAIKIDGTKVFEFWGNRSWADAGYMNGKSIELTAGEHDIEAYYVKFGGEQMADIRAAKDGGAKESVDTLFDFAMKADCRAVRGLSGDYGKINDMIGGGGGRQSTDFEANKNYDASIEAIQDAMVKVGESVTENFNVPNSEWFRPAAADAGCAGNEAIMVKYEGTVTPDESGEYEFGLAKVDNGIVIEIDGTRVCEYWGAATWYDDGKSGTIYNGSKIALEAGKAYPIMVKYLELDGGEALEVNVKRDGSETSLADSGLKFTYAKVQKSSNTDITEVAVNGVKAARTDDKFSVEVAKADKYDVVVTLADAKAKYKVAEDLKSIKVTAEDETVKLYDLDITVKEETTTPGGDDKPDPDPNPDPKPEPKPDPKPGDNNNVNKPADNKKPAASKKASVKKITIKQGKKAVKTIKIKLKKKTIRLKAVVTGKNLTKAYKKISWTTSKKKIATVSSKGVVKLKKKGTVKITAKNKKSGKKATVKIIIKK